MAGKTPGIRLPDIHRGIPAPAFGNHTQLEVGLGTPYFCRGGNWLTRSEKGHTVFWKGVFVVIIILILAFIYFTTY